MEFCKVYASENGRVIFAVSGLDVVGLKIDGTEIVCPISDDDVTRAARIANSDYDFYKGWSALHILTDASAPGECCNCPWRGLCDSN